MRAVITCAVLAACGSPPPPAASLAELPVSLGDTGLYADWSTRTIAASNRAFTPQYPLWTDGATKRRWIHLPPGGAIDARDLDAWRFPVGTKLWKEFSFGRPVETRYMERTAEGWRYATYLWSDEGTAATLAPVAGVRASAEIAPGVGHAIPSGADCRVCHGAGPTPVLGFSALQLSPDRDPAAPHREPVAADAMDLDSLVTTGVLRGVPDSLHVKPPRIAARTATERAALGYLHGNCGGCHRSTSPLASVGVVLAYSLESQAGRDAVLESLLGRPSHFTLPGEAAATRIVAGDPTRSVLLARIRSREPVVQMPPLGTQLVDDEASALIASWITSLAHLPTPNIRGEAP